MIETYWDDFTSNEKELFQRVVRRLLKNTFIVRDKDESSRNYYYFAKKHEAALREYLSYIGFDITVSDRDYATVMLENSSAEETNSKRVQANRRALNKMETILLCSLWSIYTDNVTKGSLKKVIEVPIIELKMQLEKYGVKDQTNAKVLFKKALDTLKYYNLLNYENYGNPNCVIILYPSLQFALNDDEFERFAKTAIERTKQTIAVDGINNYSDVNEVNEDGEFGEE